MIASVITNFQSIIVFVIFLSVLIIVHEWGHFITAKRLGINVQRFALGFGPTLYSKTYNGTTYMINAIPLGGYVKMAGDERSECTGDSREFYSQSIGRRSLVVLNGPVVNFILAYISFIFVFMVGYPGQSSTIAELVQGGPAHVAGLEVGDRIVAINSKKIYGWLNLKSRLAGGQGGPINVTVKRDGVEVTRTVVPDIISEPNLVGRFRAVRDLGIGNLPNLIGGFAKGYPAQKAGLLVGDRIIEIDSQKITSWASLQKAIANSTGDQIRLKIVRDDQVITKTIVPKIDVQKDENGEEVQKRKIGIGPQQEFDLYKFGIWNSVKFAGQELLFITTLTYESLFRMITGAMPAKDSVTGPVGIFYIVKGAAEAGISHLLFILGVISASLAIFNLLPIIPLDGGHLFLFGLEKIRGKALSPQFDEYVARAGFSLIILLAIFVFYSDFARFVWFDHISNWFGQLGKLLL